MYTMEDGLKTDEDLGGVEWVGWWRLGGRRGERSCRKWLKVAGDAEECE